MKKLSLVVIIVLSVSCKAQIMDDLYLPSSDVASDGYYYKDINNDINPFEGTWIYTNSGKSLEMVLTKKVRLHITVNNNNYYTDALAGGYKYIDNGIEIINTLTSINPDHNNVFEYNIAGKSISRFGDPMCHDCTAANQRKIYGVFDQPNCEGGPPTNFNLRYFTDNGIEKIEVVFYKAGPILGNFDPNDTTQPECTEYLVPYGRYIFIKQ